MDGFQAVVLGVKLKYLDAWIAARQSVAAQHDRLLADSKVITPRPCPDGRHVYHLYVIQDPERHALQDHLEQQNVATGLPYPIPIRSQKPFRGLGYKGGDFPVTEELAGNCLSLPVYPELSKRQIEQVVGAIRSAER